MLRKCIIFSALLLILCCNSYAEINVTAAYKHYDRYRDILIAKGNVVVTGNNFKIESPYVIRHFKDDKFVAMDKFEFEKDGYRIAGTNLEYNLRDGSGNAERIRINFGETYIGGRYMTMTKDKFEIYDAYFTGCNSPASDYHISAGHVALYPKTGLIVAYYATCWVWIAPVIPVPTFFYSAPVPRPKYIQPRLKIESPPKKVKEQIKDIKTTQPIPEGGSNPVDGKFIRQGFNWYFSPKSYFRLTLSYMEKNRLGAQASANYILNDNNEGELRFGSNEGENFYWGMTHYYSLGPKLLTKDDEEWLIYDFYKPGGKYSYELEIKYSDRERINGEKNIGPFSRVSFTPMLTLRSNRKPIPYLGDKFSYFWEASRATVSEEVNVEETLSTEGYFTSSPRTNYYADVSYNTDIPWLGKFKAMADASFSDYEKLGSWDRSRQVLVLQQDLFDKLTIEEGNIHYYIQRGYSPYLFESYYYSPYDQFIGSVKLKAWFSYFKIKTSYNLPSWDPYDVSYQWFFGLHCYNVIFEYSVFRKEFNFSFELVPSRW